MSTYKVIQDIEAEDKILGPLTLRQFIYALISAALLYICFIIVSKHIYVMLLIFLPPALFTGFFAFPFGRDQPTEVWAVAKIRFLFKPRRRIWNQSGVKQLVTITAPKKVEVVLTNGLSQTEVQNRLSALAQTIDSRGWATKNANVNLYNSSGLIGSTSSDRLINMDNIPQQVPSYDVQASDDMLDEVNNPIAQQFEHMIDTSEQKRRKDIEQELSSNAPPAPVKANGPAADYWFLNQPAAPTNLPTSQAMFDGTQVVHPGQPDPAAASNPTSTPQPNTSADDEAALSAQLKARGVSSQLYHGHIRTIQPLGSQPAAPPEPPQSRQAGGETAPPNDDAMRSTSHVNSTGYNPPTPTSQPPAGPGSQNADTPGTPQHDPAILSLANNNDLNVATLAREAYKAKNPGAPPQDEVVISLH